ncbi:MAG: hypothetical protein GY951_00080 [Psychromonas sp.]|nr:hypothetical protein [Alteromonadales bacterium]MCP5076449.1 hypothetical protein [Psychromonas sp.]
MLKKTIAIAVLSALIPLTAQAGFGFNDIKPGILDECDNSADKAKCNKKAAVGLAIKVGAVVLAAKLIKELVIEFKSRQIKTEKEVNVEYLEKNEALPEEAKVDSYTTNIDPGKVVPVGKPTTINSQLTVVGSKHSKTTDIEEKIEFFDNEDTNLVINTLTKKVNEKSRLAGTYDNSFTFTLPEAMPQGVYKIKTLLIVNGKEFEPITNEMQVVLTVFPDKSYQYALVD